MKLLIPLAKCINKLDYVYECTNDLSDHLLKHICSFATEGSHLWCGHMSQYCWVTEKPIRDRV